MVLLGGVTWLQSGGDIKHLPHFYTKLYSAPFVNWINGDKGSFYIYLADQTVFILFSVYFVKPQ